MSEFLEEKIRIALRNFRADAVAADEGVRYLTEFIDTEIAQAHNDALDAVIKGLRERAVKDGWRKSKDAELVYDIATAIAEGLKIKNDGS